jgi:hypothetical protein
MATPTLPEGVKSETVTWHLADGTPTNDKDKAVTAEVVTINTDGTRTHTLMRRKPKADQAGTART